MLIEVSKVEGEENKKEYKVTPKVSVQENKAVTVDVSGYTEPVEILPPEGKVAMEKVTLTLDNIPSGGGAIAYAWDFYEEGSKGDPGRKYFNFDVAPEDKVEFTSESAKSIYFYPDNSDIEIYPISLPPFEPYEYISDTQFKITRQEEGNPVITIYTRADSSNDINIWEWVPTGGGGGGEEIEPGLAEEG